MLSKYKELISYGFWGVLTTVINYVVYFGCTRYFHIDYLISNVAAWLIAVAFAFVTNKLFVFYSATWRLRVVIQELSVFVMGRLASLGVESILLYVLVDLFHARDDLTKIITNVLVIIMNYILSKYVIFRHRDSDVKNGGHKYNG